MANYSKNFLTSMTGYVNFDDNTGNGDPVTKPSNQTTNNVSVDKWNALKQKYAGNLPKVKPFGSSEPGGALDKRMDWLNWANKSLPTSGTPVELASKAAKTTGFNDAALLLASTMEEGVGLRFNPNQSYSNAYANANEKGELKGFPIDAFRTYGLDQLGGRVDEFINKGYLPKDFKTKMKTFSASNEVDEKQYYEQAYKSIQQYDGLLDKDFKYANNRKIYDKLDAIMDEFEIEGVPEMKTSAKTAALLDDESAFMAKAAFMRAEQDEILKYAKQKGYNITPEERQFFTLASYNGGSGNGKSMLDYYADKKLLGNNGFLRDRGNKGQIYDNIMPRYAGAKLFAGEGYVK
jgi:hypothetical protein